MKNNKLIEDIEVVRVKCEYLNDTKHIALLSSIFEFVDADLKKLNIIDSNNRDVVDLLNSYDNFISNVMKFK